MLEESHKYHFLILKIYICDFLLLHNMKMEEDERVARMYVRNSVVRNEIYEPLSKDMNKNKKFRKNKFAMNFTFVSLSRRQARAK